jgi:hypothetical protein
MIAASTAELPAIPGDALELAARNELTTSLHSLLAMTRDVFPGCSITLRVERDAEIESEEYIVIEVDATGWSVEDMFTARNRWTQEFCRICPPENSVIFQIRLVQSA